MSHLTQSFDFIDTFIELDGHEMIDVKFIFEEYKNVI